MVVLFEFFLTKLWRIVKDRSNLTPAFFKKNRITLDKEIQGTLNSEDPDWISFPFMEKAICFESKGVTR
jgi:hypothetical protein